MYMLSYCLTVIQESAVVLKYITCVLNDGKKKPESNCKCATDVNSLIHIKLSSSLLAPLKSAIMDVNTFISNNTHFAKSCDLQNQVVSDALDVRYLCLLTFCRTCLNTSVVIVLSGEEGRESQSSQSRDSVLCNVLEDNFMV